MSRSGLPKGGDTDGGSDAAPGRSSGSAPGSSGRGAPVSSWTHPCRGWLVCVALLVSVRSPGAVRASPPSLEVASGILGSLRVWAEPSGAPEGVVLPPRPDVLLPAWCFDLPVPLIRQIGDKSNCGPTAAAMAVASYLDRVTPEGLRDLRNAIGEWTWQRFPRRQRRDGGADVGGSTRTMMRQSLERFGEPRWLDVDHPWLPREVWSIVALKRHVAERRPLVVLAEAARLWNVRAPGLHWVVVVGFDRGRVLVHDPADGQRTAVALPTFWTAWRLPAELRGSSPGFEGLVADRSLPVRWPLTPRDRMAGLSAPNTY